MSKLLKRLEGEEGVAMIVAIGALTAIAIILAGVASTSVSLSGSTERDRHSKRALAGTEAGLREAMYKLNNRGPLDNECIGTVAFDAATGVCATPNQTLGNGTTYSYYMTKVPFTGTCAGVGASSDVNIAVRCLTVEATAAGVSRRVQARVSRYLGTPLLPVPGIFAKDGMYLNSDSTINGQLGSNGLVDMNGTNTVRDGVKTGPAGSWDLHGKTLTSSVSPALSKRTAAEGEYQIAPIEFGQSHLEANNDNGAPATGNGGWTGAATYNPTARTLHITGSTFTFHGGTYNLCSVTTSNGLTVNVPAGKAVLLLIDSPSRTGSACGAGTGFFRAENDFTLNNPNNAEAFQLHAYGATPNPVIQFKNKLGTDTNPFKGVLHAWQGTVELLNDSSVTGGIAAKRFTALGKLKFSYPSGFAIRANTSPVYARSYWHECRAQPTTSGQPTSGC